jgi:hypothetical protein
MVAIVGVGESIEKTIRYNEEKVNDRQAVLLAADGFPLPASELKLHHKIKWFKEIVSRNQLTELNSIHIVLSFHRKDKLKGVDLEQLSRDYLEGIGFSGQPFLLYKHKDTTTPHLHIVTTNIRDDGKRIDTHLIGKRLSSPVREKLESKYNLIRARGRREQERMLQGIREEDIYEDTKRLRAKLRNIVREVFDTYHYSSFEEYALILRLLGVKADKGEAGTRMLQYNGLVYAPLNYDGVQDGKSIKASQIYSSPTMDNITLRFDQNKQHRKNYRGRAILVMRQALAVCSDAHMLEEKLKADGIEIVFHTNDENRAFGLTLVDHVTRNVFKGSELGKEFSANRVLEKISENGNPQLAYNRVFVREQLRIPQGKYRFPSLIAAWKAAGLCVLPHRLQDRGIEYFVGHRSTTFASFIPAPAFMRRVLERINDVHEKRIRNPKVFQLCNDNCFWNTAGNYFIQSVSGFWEANAILWEPTPEVYDLPPQELLREARKKKKRKRRD